ncbi:DUF4192 domain-containing protein [Nocardioides sp. zg-536]|uniref:DUF4192 domain-containing protein n=1 Tax=Nocardioides faecalis TaxID=2803858 RepID=A0A939BTE0_9ACTN|nr:DUF4192 domain-containing protein [Nocardioides faecalis]MBM9460554.1 DUF4192 domain-containing protein [Nocardioides faecalis]MBS4754383.1 DUF4192 domain-containing protein [Nocardioides faecalis]QVI57516.1 DUF4192 domain-containing protein [Nocardioides faecalis]
MTTPPDAPVTTLTARAPEDLLAVAPVLLGFWPEESIVMLTFGARRPFHARLDLPGAGCRSPAVLDEVARLLIAPARRHAVRHVVLLYFTAEAAGARAVHRRLVEELDAARIGVVTALVADGHRYRELNRGPAEAVEEGPGDGMAGGMGDGTPYDVSAHPFVVEALVAGRLRHRDREDLVASLRPDPAAVAAVQAEVERQSAVRPDVPRDPRGLRAAGTWVQAVLGELVEAGAPPEVDELAVLLRVLQVPRVRDAAWTLIRRAEAEAHVRFWEAVVVRCPDALLGPPAALLGWAAWQAGDGARAWAAVDRCRASAPGYGLAEHLARLLSEAAPPEVWQGGFDWAIGLPPLGRGH